MNVRNVLAGTAASCLLGALAAPAAAITITYENPGPADSRVFVGIDNDSSGWTTYDVISHENVFSRSDTAYGPLPPTGQLPSFDAEYYASAELGTNLNAPLGTGIRSVFSPLNPTFFRASGMTLQPTGVYASHSFVYSGPATPAENIGDPAVVTIDASISSTLTVSGAASADATWTVTTTTHGGVIGGGATQTVPGVTPFSDSGTLRFQVLLGDTFELAVDYDLNAAGSGAGAASESNVDASLVEISAALGTLFLAPAPVQLAFAEEYPTGEIIEWVERAGGDIWMALFDLDGRTRRAVYRADGTSGERPRVGWFRH